MGNIPKTEWLFSNKSPYTKGKICKFDFTVYFKLKPFQLYGQWSYLPLCLFLWRETFCSRLPVSRLWIQRWCRRWTPRLWEADQCLPALASPLDTGWIAAHLERALTPRPAVLRAVGGAARESNGGKLARFGWATLMVERCRSRILPAIRYAIPRQRSSIWACFNRQCSL